MVDVLRSAIPGDVTQERIVAIADCHPAGSVTIPVVAAASTLKKADRQSSDIRSRSAVFILPVETVDQAESWSAFPLSEVRSEFELHRDITEALAPVTKLSCHGCWSVESCRKERSSSSGAQNRRAFLSPCGWVMAKRADLPVDVETVLLDLTVLLPARA